MFHNAIRQTLLPAHDVLWFKMTNSLTVTRCSCNRAARLKERRKEAIVWRQASTISGVLFGPMVNRVLLYKQPTACALIEDRSLGTGSVQMDFPLAALV